MTPIAYSPCPNDTYLFHAWAHGIVGQELPIEPHLGDIQQLNEWAIEGRFPISKVSWAVLPEILDRYIALPLGAALGWGVGPKIVAKERFPLEELSTKRVAIPGRHTTAHKLLGHLAPPPKESLFCLFHEMTRLLDKGVVDGAVIIHEQRFTFEQAGFVEIADLGTLWEERYALPVPLGALVARRDLPNLDQVCAILKESLETAHRNPDSPLSYILEHAQEMAPDVVQRHIKTYVTDESLGLSEKAIAAIDQLLGVKGWLHT